jgi:unsaturated rhamnogalacturonyl hydrolase
MFYRKTRFIIVAGFLLSQSSAQAYDGLKDFPEEKSPKVIGKKVAEDLLGRKHHLSSFMRNNSSLHYAEVFTAYGALKFADLTGDQDLLLSLERRYRPMVDENRSAYLPNGYHGDYTAVAMVPFELYRLRGDKRFLELGVEMVKKQWEYTNPKDGLTWQARWWIDDVYMVAAVDALATRVTGDMTWVRNGAYFTWVYMNKLQDKTGLLPHTANVRYYWARGVGWVAAGLVETLTTLPEWHPLYAPLMIAYKKLMAGLLPLQAESGLWRQLLDDPTAWEETSGTAMFVYSYIVGVRKGWLDEAAYGPAARKGWLALADKVNDTGQLSDICVGTNEMKGADNYLKRERSTGDFHGQAPLLWCVNALLEKQ